MLLSHVYFDFLCTRSNSNQRRSAEMWFYRWTWLFHFRFRINDGNLGLHLNRQRYISNILILTPFQFIISCAWTIVLSSLSCKHCWKAKKDWCLESNRSSPKRERIWFVEVALERRNPVIPHTHGAVQVVVVLDGENLFLVHAAPPQGEVQCIWKKAYRPAGKLQK